MHKCKAIGCTNLTDPTHDFCSSCNEVAGFFNQHPSEVIQDIELPNPIRMPKEHEEIDIHEVLHRLHLNDPSGCLQMASLELLQTGGMDATQRYEAVSKAQSLLRNWLRLNAPY